MLTTKTRTKWDNVTIKLRCPEGTAFIEIAEEYPGKINRISITIGKAGSSVNAQAYAIAELTTELFNLGKSINDVIAKLTGITSDRVVRAESGVDVRSIPEALILALHQYRSTVPTTRVSRFRIKRNR